jgi:hypothetical protein
MKIRMKYGEFVIDAACMSYFRHAHKNLIGKPHRKIPFQKARQM